MHGLGTPGFLSGAGLHVRYGFLKGTRKDGTHADFMVTLTIHKDQEGNVLQTEGFFRDITESKKTEEEIKYLKEYNENILSDFL